MYNTPYGALAVGINTKKMRTQLSPVGGSIEINYALEIDHSVAGENLFHIRGRQKGSSIRQ